jgi:hypothetical protein
MMLKVEIKGIFVATCAVFSTDANMKLADVMLSLVLGTCASRTPVFLKTLYTSKGFELADCTV